VDSLAWAAGLLVAAWARYDFVLRLPRLRAVALAVAVAVTIQQLVGHLLLLYRGRYAFGCFEEVRGVSGTVTVTATLLFFGNLVPMGRPVPASTPLTGGALALLFMLGFRYVRRLRIERTMRPDATAATPVLVLGAGGAGTRLVRSMLREPRSRYLPVGLVDDDPAKRRLRVNGVAVLGSTAELAEIIARTEVTAVVFAIPSAPPATVRATRRVVDACGVSFKVLPSMTTMLDRPVAVSDIRDVDVTDLLGRGPVETDLTSIAGYLKGRRVLVTGAGGSIGSELCRQVHRFRPAELIMLDRDESALHAVQLSVSGRALLDDREVILADLRDRNRIHEVFAERRPQVVFHAAALKHQPLLEQYPTEAVRTNVWGTITVLEAAAAQGVEVLVNISTDKAADPCSVLGYSKRITERITSHVAGDVSGRYLSVRFGNVLGSRGSVLTTFAAQIAGGHTVTVTDQRVSRYFMTVQEAVQLVIQAGAVGRPGEALVLDMGEPVRIDDIARQMAALAGERVEIVYTGLRAGEKLHETLFGEGERDDRPCHPLISHVAVPPLAPGLARSMNLTAPRDAVIGELITLCESEDATAGAATLPCPPDRANSRIQQLVRSIRGSA
jgi:FlaA1/EpsC-like NDP-sugar epimerase